jgi:branched-chain amino acid transport system substrate-binding protein
MQEFSRRVGSGSVGVYAADKPDGEINPAALSPAGRSLLAKARAELARTGQTLDIPAVAGFVGGWTLVNDVLPKVSGPLTADAIRSAALSVDVPTGDSINGGGVRFGADGALDGGQNTRAAAVIGQWQAVGVMNVLFPPAYSTNRSST